MTILSIDFYYLQFIDRFLFDNWINNSIITSLFIFNMLFILEYKPHIEENDILGKWETNEKLKIYLILLNVFAAIKLRISGSVQEDRIFVLCSVRKTIINSFPKR